MTATELIDHVKKEKIAAYWFGPIPENKYTIICTDRDEILISYIPSGATLHASSESNILIETYSSPLNGEGPLASPVAKDADDILAMQNESGRGNVEPIIHPRYSIEGTERVVEVHYPTVDASLNEKFGQANLKLIQ